MFDDKNSVEALKVFGHLLSGALSQVTLSRLFPCFLISKLCSSSDGDDRGKVSSTKFPEPWTG